MNMLRLARLFFEFLRDIHRNHRLILTLTKRDLKARNLGSAFGLAWTFAQPMVTILVMWFVFSYGLKSPPVTDCPFSIWLICGMIPWFFISDSLLSATYAVSEYSFLVKNVSVRLSVLPIVKILSALVIHVAMVLLMLVFSAFYGIYPGPHALQIIYYQLAAMALLLGISWCTSSLMLFLKDVGQALGILLQLGFWGTPIIWNLTLIPERYQWLFKLNPALYIVQGFRDALIYKVWFWEHPALSAYFWTLTLVAFCGGALLFKRLRPHFADVV